MSDERKPVWEQQWSRDADRIYVETDDGSERLVLQSYEDSQPPANERYPHDYFPCAKLAEAAPDMARALLAFERAYEHYSRWPTAWDEMRKAHALVEDALRKAGVR